MWVVVTLVASVRRGFRFLFFSCCDFLALREVLDCGRVCAYRVGRFATVLLPRERESVVLVSFMCFFCFFLLL